jgi:hypothetical protein
MAFGSFKLSLPITPRRHRGRIARPAQEQIIAIAVHKTVRVVLGVLHLRRFANKVFPGVFSDFSIANAGKACILWRTIVQGFEDKRACSAKHHAATRAGAAGSESE